MDLQLQGRTALISGASAGIGAGIAKIMAREGAQLVLVARREALLTTMADDISSDGGPRPLILPGDITHRDDVRRLAEEAAQATGGIDILVNCAGGSRPVDLDASDADWDEAFALNFTAARHLTEALLPPMLKKQWGRIINLSGSMEPRSLNAAIAAKAALHVWAKGLSCEVAAQGVTINTIQPGRIHSEQIQQRLHPTEESRRAFIEQHIPAGYFGEPEDIAHLVAFLASPLSRYITGAVIPVDGGTKRSAF